MRLRHGHGWELRDTEYDGSYRLSYLGSGPDTAVSTVSRGVVRRISHVTITITMYHVPCRNLLLEY